MSQIDSGSNIDLERLYSCSSSHHTQFLAFMAIFEVNFEALLVIGETRSKQHQIRRKKISPGQGESIGPIGNRNTKISQKTTIPGKFART